MKRALLLLFLPLSLAAAPKPGKPSPEAAHLDKLLADAGGYAKFQRLETMSCDFEDGVQTSSGAVIRRGRWALSAHDGKGFRVWEKDDAGSVTLVSSSAPVAAGERRLLADLSRVFLLQRIKEEGLALRSLTAGFFLGRLVDRVSVGGGPLFPDGEDLVLYFSQPDGVLLGASEGPGLVAFHSPEATKSLLTVPSVFVHYDAAGKKTRVVKISRIVVNGYLEEDPFAQGATP